MTRYLTWKSVLENLGVSHATLWRWTRDGRFPQPVRLSAGRIAFREDDVLGWEAERETVVHGRAAQG